VATLAGGGGEGGPLAQMGRFRLSAAFLWWTLLDGVFCYSVPSGRTALGGFLGIHFEVAEASTARCSGRNTSKLKCTQVSGAERNRSLQPDSVAMSTVRLE
jgi:hypothetical protein